MWWLHTDAGYSFHGDAPIAGLTPRELDILLLGHLVHQEQAEAATLGSGENKEMRKQKQKLRRGHRQTRKDVFGDLGIQ